MPTSARGSGSAPASSAPSWPARPRACAARAPCGGGVPRRAAGLDMKVVGFDPFLSPDRATHLGIEAVGGLDQLLPRCDCRTVHSPRTDETRDLIGAPQ